MFFLLTVNYNASHLIRKLLNSLPDCAEVAYKVVIINNSREDTGLQALENTFTSIIHTPKNLGFGSACNIGIQSIFAIDKTAIIWLINPDAYLPEINFKKIIEFFDTHSKISILGTIIYTLEGKTWFAGGKFIADRGAILQTDFSHQYQDYCPCDWVSGCSLILNLRNFTTPPVFDEKYFLYYEDLDFCQRYRRQGHQVAITSQFAVIHSPSSITNQNKFNKIRHSTFSYLLTLYKYSPCLIQLVFFIKLLIYAVILLPFKPAVALGKLVGIQAYLHYVSLDD